MREYAEVWERFVEDRRLEFGGHTDPSWREGHAVSASLMVPVDAASLRERLEPIREALRPFPFVSLHPDHFLHITLALLGFVSEKPEEEDEVSPERLREIEANARRRLSEFPAFPVRLANLNAFPGAAFVEAHAGGMIEELQEALSASCTLRKPSGPPHLTLAYFQAPDGTPAPDELVSTVARFRNWPAGEMKVESVELTLLALRADYPEPDVMATIPLKEHSS
ncbi:MAG TPA: 2'-5' RNA ligase family protein [Rubrobacteraceae bacterium]|nr:2'-5' RNA ligase family protein [Rubrobacteraceae bacterium]